MTLYALIVYLSAHAAWLFWRGVTVLYDARAAMPRTERSAKIFIACGAGLFSGTAAVFTAITAWAAVGFIHAAWRSFQ